MAERTGIQWCDATWNPWRGCSKVSPGCAHCYMFRDQQRFGHDPSTVVRAADATFYAPLNRPTWRTAAFQEAAKAGRDRPLIFTCSWSDWFHEDADRWRDEAWDVIHATPEHTYLILTKRPERMAEQLPTDWGEGWPHVWLGVSIENRRFVHRADILRETPAAVRFISAEPLLGPLLEDDYDGLWQDDYDGPGLVLKGIDWLIVGGETGPRARRMNPEWVRALRDACLPSCARCERAEPQCTCNPPELGGGRTAFFFKQWGGRTPKSGGRELDGRTWDEIPDVARPPTGTCQGCATIREEEGLDD